MNRIFYYNQLSTRSNRRLDEKNESDSLIINMITYNVIKRLDNANGRHQIKLSFDNTDIVCDLVITPLEVIITEKEVIDKKEAV